MIPKSCKRLAEVDFPIAEVSRNSAREKSIRHGHPSTLHLWWARRPLAACRAMLMALLMPDPCDENCPKEFKDKAAKILKGDPPVAWKTPGKTDLDLRKSLLDFIAKFSNWDNSANPIFLKTARELVKAAHPEETPLVVDPFAGGGSIPLEALRIGCNAFASDLNPVACLILKVMLEDIPRHGPELGEELRKIGKDIKEKAEKELAQFYPTDPDGATPIAYLWARTVKCESPNCGAEIPLMRSFWLCKKAGRKRALKSKVIRLTGKAPEIEFEIFSPKKDTEIPDGTVTRAKATCLACGNVLPPDRVRSQLVAQRGGADSIFNGKGNRKGGARLLAVVTLIPDEQCRHYRLPTDNDYKAIRNAQKRLKIILNEWECSGKKGLCPVPDEPVDVWHHDVNRLPMYGMQTWGEIFSARQKLSFECLSRQILSYDMDEYLKPLISMICTKLVDRCNSLVNWSLGVECPNQVFKGNAIPFAWDYAESNLLSDSSASISKTIENIARNVEASIIPGSSVSDLSLADACEHPLPDQSASVWFTDPPYYDAIDYAHCSDYFFVWFKRILLGHPLLRDPFDDTNLLTPKMREIVVDSLATKGHGTRTPEFYERQMAKAFAEGHRILQKNGIASVVFAHKTTQGWEALLSGMIQGGWIITGSWPIATERYSRLRARDSAALATSVHLVCRPRSEDAPIGDWGDVLRELPQRVGDWIERLQGEGIRGADLVFACIGPALEIFSRYSKVETADGKGVKLDQYLEKVWEVVGRTALELILGTAEARARNGLAGALEEDARLTALFLWTLQSTNGNGKAGATEEPNADESEAEDDEDTTPKGKTGGYSLVFDVVRRFAQPLGINLPIWEDRIIETKKGVVRLLSIGERAKGLFGEAGAQAVAHELERDPALAGQFEMALGVVEAAPKVRGSGRKMHHGAMVSDDDLSAKHGATTLDRVHAAMLLQRSGKTNALRALLKAEQQRSPDFLRLANALSALYPKKSEGKRLLDAMLLAVGR